jgi:hypothetical protein
MAPKKRIAGMMKPSLIIPSFGAALNKFHIDFGGCYKDEQAFDRLVYCIYLWLRV